MPDAAVHIGNMQGSQIVNEYYQRCGYENIGPAMIRTGEIANFITLNGLIDHLLSRPELHQVIVNHGNDALGLIMRFASTATHSSTGHVIGDLSDLADRSTSGGLSASDGDVKNTAQMMGVTPAIAIQLVDKLAKLRKKQLILHFRGCNVGKNASMLSDYKRAFGALAITAPTCRMFYLRIIPHRPARGHTITGMRRNSPLTARTRRRFFDDSRSLLGPMIIDIRDIDGHTMVDSESFIDNSHDILGWANVLNKQWRQAPQGPSSNRFVLPVMWENSETSYHTPFAAGQKLAMV